jgi:3-methylcrotonyl-CoA carboxylase beta subunit
MANLENTLNTTLPSSLNLATPRSRNNAAGAKLSLETISAQEKQIAEGGGPKAIESQHAKKRLTARERIALLLDPGTELLELALFAAFGMYEEWGGAPSAGVVTGIGHVAGRLVMIIANDATVKAGAFFPMTAKKVIRAQAIAMENRIPTLYLVDSAGVFLRCRRMCFRTRMTLGASFATTR